MLFLGGLGARIMKTLSYMEPALRETFKSAELGRQLRIWPFDFKQVGAFVVPREMKSF